MNTDTRRFWHDAALFLLLLSLFAMAARLFPPTDPRTVEPPAPYGGE